MKNNFWLCKRGRIFYSHDSSTGKRESLRTADRNKAQRIINAKNEALRTPAINVAIAKA